MKYYNHLLYTFLIGISMGSSAYGMEDLMKSSLVQPTIEPYSEETSFKPLAKPSFLEFYSSINSYLRNKSVINLESAKKALQETFINKQILKFAPYSSFLKSASPDENEINVLKRFLNAAYFTQNPADLCLSIPHFLKSINQNNPNTTDDLLKILKLLAENKPVYESTLKTAEENIKIIIATHHNGLDQYSIERCLELLDKPCNFFPEKTFKKASHELIESQLFSLLYYDAMEDPNKQLIKKTIIANIDKMIHFIPTGGYRIGELERIKEAIETANQFSLEMINPWIKEINYITITTLNPDPLSNSEIQIKNLKEQESKKEKQEEEELRNATQKQLFAIPSTMLMYNYDKLLYYMNEKNWPEQDKIYVLQLLFWQAHKAHSSGLQVSLIKALKTMNAPAPKIAHQGGMRPHPVFSYSPEELPEDAPPALIFLFNQLKKEEMENLTANPDLTIEMYYNDIQKQEKNLKNNLESMSGKAEKFYEKYLIPDLPSPSQELPEQLRIQDTEKTRLAGINNAEWAQQQQAQNIKFHKGRIAEKKELSEELLPQPQKRISANLSAFIKRDQNTMDELISEQVEIIKAELESAKKIIQEAITNKQENLESLVIQQFKLLFQEKNRLVRFQKYSKNSPDALRASIVNTIGKILGFVSGIGQDLMPAGTESGARSIYEFELATNDTIFSIFSEILKRDNYKKIKTDNPETIAKVKKKLKKSLENIAKLKKSSENMQSQIMNLLQATLQGIQQEGWQSESSEAKIAHLKLKQFIAQIFTNMRKLELQMAGEDKDTIEISSKNFVTNFIKIAEIIEKIPLDIYDKLLIEDIVERPLFIQRFVNKEATELQGKPVILLPEGKEGDFNAAYAKIKDAVYKPTLIQPTQQPISTPLKPISQAPIVTQMPVAQPAIKSVPRPNDDEPKTEKPAQPPVKPSPQLAATQSPDIAGSAVQKVSSNPQLNYFDLINEHIAAIADEDIIGVYPYSIISIVPMDNSEIPQTYRITIKQLEKKAAEEYYLLVTRDQLDTVYKMVQENTAVKFGGIIIDHTEMTKKILNSIFLKEKEPVLPQPLSQPALETPMSPAPQPIQPAQPSIEPQPKAPQPPAGQKQPVAPAPQPADQPPQAQPQPIVAEQQPTAPKPGPSLWSSITTPVSNFVSNVWQGIKNLITNIVIRLLFSPSTKENSGATEKFILEQKVDNEVITPIDQISAANRIIQIVEKYALDNKDEQARKELDALTELYLSDYRSAVNDISSATLTNNKPKVFYQLGNFLEEFNRKHEGSFSPDQIEQFKKGSLKI